MIATTPKTSFRLLRATNAGSLTTITDKSPTTTEPAEGSGVFGCGAGDGDNFNAIKLIFFGVGSAGTFTARIWAWYLIKGVAGETWVPVHMLDVLVTLGTAAADLAGTGQLFGTTIALSGTATVESSAYAIESPGSNRVAMLKLDPAGARKIEVQFGTTATATSANGAAAGF